MLAAAALSSVVTMSNVPFVPTVKVAVSLVEPVIVITLPSIPTSSTVKAPETANVVPSNVKFASASSSVVVAPTVTSSFSVALFNAVTVPVATKSKVLSVSS